MGGWAARLTSRAAIPVFDTVLGRTERSLSTPPAFTERDVLAGRVEAFADGLGLELREAIPRVAGTSYRCFLGLPELVERVAGGDSFS
jgi:hypothetical protein